MRRKAIRQGLKNLSGSTHSIDDDASRDGITGSQNAQAKRMFDEATRSGSASIPSRNLARPFGMALSVPNNGNWSDLNAFGHILRPRKEVPMRLALSFDIVTWRIMLFIWL